MSAFALNVRCNNYHALYWRDQHDASFCNSFESYVCGACGHHGFYDVTERWVSTARLFRPWTWCSGYWEEKGQTED